MLELKFVTLEFIVNVGDVKLNHFKCVIECRRL